MKFGRCICSTYTDHAWVLSSSQTVPLQFLTVPLQLHSVTGEESFTIKTSTPLQPPPPYLSTCRIFMYKPTGTNFLIWKRWLSNKYPIITCPHSFHPTSSKLEIFHVAILQVLWVACSYLALNSIDWLLLMLVDKSGRGLNSKTIVCVSGTQRVSLMLSELFTPKHRFVKRLQDAQFQNQGCTVCLNFLLRNTDL